MFKAMPPEDLKEFIIKYLTYNIGDEISVKDFTNPMTYAFFKQEQSKIDYNETKWENKSKRNKRYYESHKATITPNKESFKPSIEDEYKVDMPNIQLEDEDIPAIEPEPTPEPEPVFKVSSEPVSKKFRYYDFDTNNSISINSAIESNKNNLTFGAVKSDLIKQIIKDGHTESEAENIYINILKTVTQNRGNDENPF